MFLASSGLSGLEDVLDDPASFLQLLYIPTAANLESSAPWADDAYRQLAEMGFQIDTVDLATATPARTAQAMAACDVVFLGGGNTYYLLDCVNRSGFREAFEKRPEIVYAGSSAGSVLAANDISYIGDADDPTVVPDLASTKGLGLVEFSVMPHASASEATAGVETIYITDDQAIVVVDGQHRVVPSPSV